MIRVIFTVKDDIVTCFEISGHSGFSEEGSDVVCAAVSSAAYMAANTVTEVQGLACRITVEDGFMKMDLSEKEAKKARVVMNGLWLHLDALSQEYAEFIELKISEV